MIKISSEIVIELAYLDENDKYEGFEVIESGKWEDCGKSSCRGIIVKHNEKYYEIVVSRSGSYYTDYYYNWEDKNEFECEEVERKEKVIIEWVAKK